MVQLGIPEIGKKLGGSLLSRRSSLAQPSLLSACGFQLVEEAPGRVAPIGELGVSPEIGHSHREEVSRFRLIGLQRKAGENNLSHTDSKWLHLIGEAARCDFARIAQIVGYELDVQKILVEPGPAPHKRSALRQNHMAVYSFWRDKEALKVGLVSPNNDARFRFHHYSPGTSNSNLAHTISQRFVELGLVTPPTNYRDWIEIETGRLDFIMPASWGQPVARLLEGYLHARWRPRFEGRAWSGYSESLPAPNFDVSAQGIAPT